MRRVHREEGAMPHVQITWVEGRTADQKRKVVERITKALEEEGRAKRENIHVAFLDVPATNYAEAGVLGADQKRSPRGIAGGLAFRLMQGRGYAPPGANGSAGRAFFPGGGA